LKGLLGIIPITFMSENCFETTLTVLMCFINENCFKITVIDLVILMSVTCFGITLSEIEKKKKSRNRKKVTLLIL
jgi:hypothetical protein